TSRRRGRRDGRRPPWLSAEYLRGFMGHSLPFLPTLRLLRLARHVLPHHLLPLLFPAALLAARVHARHQRDPPVVRDVAEHREQTAERELRRENDRQEEQREDQDDGAGAIEIVRQQGGQPIAEVAPRTKRFPTEVDGAERERQERRNAAEEQRRSQQLRIDGIDRP